MTGAPIPLGTVGKRVASNVRVMRLATGMSYADLSRALADHGRPIPPLGLARLEKGERRVDVDDLEALVEVLSVDSFDVMLIADLRLEVTS